ncbi:hypothetical protein VOLCADRAFT_103252 [Volvox carteri f. nagariensis]|uniref:Uncharacterized protein n=1 Tax=Volvox carteri f. nagariensis TaxID=3068 RepID=D8TKI1_VOLCA|nr:uncharacterized protein VOLCADRAFT_103252 [Volvox carteri f. nagariensis]EFJ52068.1 hypothetical protein VOLCADRAFT_103252 [Volvox carteri f. nagariensis]|eukprot:XP_002946842.1 hypothetical protein VOLCADRAFT_103252 [Volvox carteri f. nagariensis]
MADEAPTASMSEVSAFELVRSNQAFCDYIKGIHTDRGATLKPDSSTRSDAAYQQYQKQHQQLHSHDLGAAAEPFALAADSSALGPQISPVAATAVSAPVHELDCAALQIVRNASSCGGGGGSSSTGAILLPRGPISTSDPGSATAALAAAAFALAAAAAQHRSLGGAVASQSPPPVQGFDMCRVRCNISFIPEDEEVDAASDGEEREEDLREMGVLAADVADTDTGSGARTCSGARRSAASRGQSVCEGVYELRRLLLPAAVPTTPQHSSAQRALYTQQEREHVSAQQGLPAGAGAVVSADSVESVCVMQESILPTESASSVSSSSSVSSAPELRLADSADLHEAYKCHASMVNLCGGEESCAGYEEQRGFQGPCRDVVTSNCGADSCEREAGAAFSCGSCEMDESSCGEPAPMTPSRQHPHLPVCSPCGKTELLVAAGADTAATAAAALSVAADAALVPAVEAGFEVEEEDGNIITYPLGPGCEPSMLLHYSSSPEAAPHGSMLALSAGPSPRSFPVGSPLRDSPARQPQPCPSGLSAAALSSASFLHAASVRSRRTSAPRSAPTSSGGAMADFPLTVPDLSRGVPAPVPEHPASTGPSSSTSIHVDMLHTSHDPPELPVDPSASSFSQLGMPVPLAPALSMARTSTRYRRSTAGGSTSTASSSAVCTPRSVASTTALYGARGGSQGGSHVHVVGTQNASLHTLHNHSTTLKAIAAAGTPAALAAAACASLELCRRRQAREQLVQQAAATLCGGADCPSYLRPTLSSAAKSLLLQHQPPPPHPPPYRPSVTAGPTPTSYTDDKEQRRGGSGSYSPSCRGPYKRSSVHTWIGGYASPVGGWVLLAAATADKQEGHCASRGALQGTCFLVPCRK